MSLNQLYNNNVSEPAQNWKNIKVSNLDISGTLSFAQSSGSNGQIVLNVNGLPTWTSAGGALAVASFSRGPSQPVVDGTSAILVYTNLDYENGQFGLNYNGVNGVFTATTSSVYSLVISGAISTLISGIVFLERNSTIIRSQQIGNALVSSGLQYGAYSIAYIISLNAGDTFQVGMTSGVGASSAFEPNASSILIMRL